MRRKLLFWLCGSATVLVGVGLTVHAKSSWQYSHCVQAVSEGSSDKVRGCLEAGFDPDTRDPAGDPVLIVALRRRSAVETLLVNAGANIDVQDSTGKPLIRFTDGLNDPVLFQRIFEHSRDPSARKQAGGMLLKDATHGCKHDEAAKLLAGGANVRAVDGTGLTVLGNAAWCGDSVIVKQLIALGVDVNTRGRFGGTVLMAAAERGHAETVRLLLDRGARVDYRDRLTHRTALGCALSYSNGKENLVTKLLRSAGGRP